MKINTHDQNTTTVVLLLSPKVKGHHGEIHTRVTHTHTHTHTLTERGLMADVLKQYV